MAHNHTVIWDWNGTLLDDVALCARLIDTLLTRHGYAPVGSLEKYRQVFRFPVRAYYEDVGFDFSRHPFDELAANIWSCTPRRARPAALCRARWTRCAACAKRGCGR